MKLRVNPEAIEDIAGIKKYICEDLGNPMAAERLAEKIVKYYKRLKTMPYIGQSLSAKIEIETDYRYLICDNYLIFYKVSGSMVSIHRVIYGKRDYCRLLFDTESNENTPKNVSD